jgi:hypothetical protein
LFLQDGKHAIATVETSDQLALIDLELWHPKLRLEEEGRSMRVVRSGRRTDGYRICRTLPRP